MQMRDSTSRIVLGTRVATQWPRNAYFFSFSTVNRLFHANSVQQNRSRQKDNIYTTKLNYFSQKPMHLAVMPSCTSASRFSHGRSVPRRPMRVVTARRLKPTSSKLGSQAFYAETCIMGRQCFGWNSYNDISCFGLHGYFNDGKRYFWQASANRFGIKTPADAGY